MDVTTPPIFLISINDAAGSVVGVEGGDGLSRAVKERGYCVVDIELESNEGAAVDLTRWEETFQGAFSLPVQDKEASGSYRNDQGVALGYRREDSREFFETRVYRSPESSVPVVSPSFPATGFDDTVRWLFNVLSKTGVKILSSLCSDVGLDPRCIIDLTDLEQDEGKEAGQEAGRISSSLLRVCSYPHPEANWHLTLTEQPQLPATPSSSASTSPSPTPLSPPPPPPTATDPSDPQIAFGSHTDTSFLTIGLVSSTPGLEVFDQLTNSWVRLESDIAAEIKSLSKTPTGTGQPRLRAIAFVGEFLQVLTRKHYKALIHKVRAPVCMASHPLDSSLARISCPFIIRGRASAIIDVRNDSKYTHTACGPSLEALLPDLDGISMKVLHRMLDHKRQKVMNARREEGEDWVLMADPDPITAKSV